MTLLGTEKVQLQSTNSFPQDITKHLGEAETKLKKQFGNNIRIEKEQTRYTTETRIKAGYGGCQGITTVKIDYEVKAYQR